MGSPHQALCPIVIPLIPVSVTATRSTVPPLRPNLVARPEDKASDLRARVGAEGRHRLGHTIEAVNLCRYRRALADPSVPVVPPNDAIRSRLINFSFFKIGIVIFGEFHFLFPFDNAAGLVAKIKDVVCYGKTKFVVGGQDDLLKVCSCQETKKVGGSVLVTCSRTLIQN